MDYYIFKNIKQKVPSEERAHAVLEDFEDNRLVVILQIEEGDSLVFRYEDDEEGNVVTTTRVLKIDKIDNKLIVETKNSVYNFEFKETIVRTLGEVLDSILNVVGEDKLDLKKSLERIKRNSGFKAPEAMSELWQEAFYVLECEYGNPLTSEEALEVFSIFSGKSKEKLRIQVQNYKAN